MVIEMPQRPLGALLRDAEMCECVCVHTLPHRRRGRGNTRHACTDGLQYQTSVRPPSLLSQSHRAAQGLQPLVKIGMQKEPRLTHSPSLRRRERGEP